ncbi:MAG TPA: hypothetical protein VF701_12110 [Thermoanaerobaculia bacterium]
MNAALVLSMIVLLAVPLSAGEPKKTEETNGQKAAAATGDSPLVAAAKRSGRRGKTPGYVITNETLKQQSGDARITTTNTQQPLVMPSAPARPTPEMAAAEEAKSRRRIADEAAAAEAKATAEREHRAAVAAGMAEEGEFVVDPEMLEELEGLEDPAPPQS